MTRVVSVGRYHHGSACESLLVFRAFSHTLPVDGPDQHFALDSVFEVAHQPSHTPSVCFCWL